MPEDRPFVARLWTGGALTALDRLVFAADRAAGARLRLYAWGPPPPGLPDWIETADAEAVSPEPDGPDRFRWRLLAALPGAIWAGPGALLLGPPPLREGRLFGFESARFVSPDLVALPPESPALARLLVACAGAEDGRWGGLGARALTEALRETGEIAAALPEGALHGPHYAERGRLLGREPLEAIAPAGAAALSLHRSELDRMLAAAGGPKPRAPLAALFRRFGVDPATPVPAAVRRPRAARAPRVLIVTAMKNEGPFILEWIAHHRAMGIEGFLVHTNDCEDGTDGILDRLAALGLVAERRDNPFRETPGKRPQHAALAAAMERPAFREAEWILPIDVDEFVNVKAGEGRIEDLVAAAPEATMISLVWRLFGDGFAEGYEDRLLTERHLLAAHEAANKPHQAWGFKTLIRNDGAWAKLDVHRPKGLRPGFAPHWIAGSGRPLPESYLREGWRVTPKTAGYALAQLNHYAVRNPESFLVKRDRGRVNHVDRDQGLAYWFRMNHNAVEERSILRRAAATRAEFARLMADAELARLHAGAVAWHRAKIAELKARPDHAALLAEIAGPRLRALSRVLARFGNAVFDRGPEAVPEDAIP